MLKILSAAILLVLLSARMEAGTLKVGTAKQVITPPEGSLLAGYYNERVMDGVTDELYSKAIVLEKDGVKVAMVVCDLVTLPREVAEEARKLIAASAAAIPADHVMISATHAHTGPIVIRGMSQDPLEGKGGDIARTYTAALPAKVAQSVIDAAASLKPADLSSTIGREEHISFNRRYFMKDGTVAWNPGSLNPKIDRPAGPIDPDLPVLTFETPEKPAKLLALYVNFAMHPDTTGGTKVSADYPAVISELIGKSKGPDIFTIFATGACGDVNHLNTNAPPTLDKIVEAWRVGTVLAADVLQLLKQVKPVAEGPLRAMNLPVSLPAMELKPGEFEAARDKVAGIKRGEKAAFLNRVQAFKVLDVAARNGKPFDVEVQVVALGNDLAWVSLPGEIFAESAMEIKKRSPFKQTIIVELANGAIGYIPTKRAFAEGAYEPTSARCAPGSAETLVETAVSLLEKIKSVDAAK